MKTLSREHKRKVFINDGNIPVSMSLIIKGDTWRYEDDRTLYTAMSDAYWKNNQWVVNVAD